MHFRKILRGFILILCTSAAAKEATHSQPKEASRAVKVRSNSESRASVNLQNAIAVALRNNPELRVFEAAIAASKGAVTKARTLDNPELTLAPGVKRTREGPLTTSEFHGEIELSQLFKFPGKRALETAIAHRNIALQQLAREGFRFQLAAKVRKVFFEMLAAEKLSALRGEQVESARTFVASARKRAESGYASDFETMKSQADLIGAQKAQQQAQAEVFVARISLNTLMGRNPSAPLAITGTIENAAPPGATGDYVALAMARNPSIRMVSAQSEIAQLTLRSTRFGRRPDFAVGPSVEYSETEQIYGFSGTIALPFWDQKRGDIETALGEQEKALAEVAKTRAEIAGEVTKATAALHAAKESAALYTPEFLEKLRAFVTQAEQGFAQNATTLIIYLDAKRTYFDTLSDYYEALGQVAVSRADLESAIGVPLETTNP